MKVKIHYKILIILLTMFFVGCSAMGKNKSSNVTNSDSPMVNMLTEKLGVSNEQATGGAGAVLGYAKNKLSPDDYAKVSKAMPESDSLIKSAPKDDGMSNKLGSMTSSMTGGSESAGGLGSLAGSFGKLGLSPDMVGKFVPIITEYANTQGGSGISGLLGSVLK